MTSNTVPNLSNSDPRILTVVVVIGTLENVNEYLRQQHLLGAAKLYEWSQPMPAVDRPGKVVTALNRIML